MYLKKNSSISIFPDSSDESDEPRSGPDNGEAADVPQTDEISNEDRIINADKVRRSLEFLDNGIGRLGSGKSLFAKIPDILQGIIGANLPSANNQISEMNARVSVLSGAVANNAVAENMISKYTRHNANLIKTFLLPFAEDMQSANLVEGAYQGELPAELLRISQNYIMSNNRAGMFDKLSTVVVAKEIFNEAESRIDELIRAYNDSKSHLARLPDEIIRGEVDSGTSESVNYILEKIYVLKEFVNSIVRNTMPSEKVVGEGAEPESDKSRTDSIGSPDSYEVSAGDLYDKLTITDIDYSIGSINEGENPAGPGAGKIVKSEVSAVDIYLIVELRGVTISELNSKAQDLLDLFIENKIVRFSEKIDKSTLALTRLSFVELGDLYLMRILMSKNALDNLSPGEDLVLVNIPGAIDLGIVVANNNISNKLTKLSGPSGTTPFYEAVSPFGGESVSFTPSDLVSGGGKIKDSKGRSFRPKKIKGRSLSKRVMSKGFGKVKKK